MEHKLTKISQIGFVVEDLDAVTAWMKKIFGADPVIAKAPERERKYYGGEGDFEAEIAFYDFANIQLEFVKPIKGSSIWQDFLNEGKKGLHHIRFSVDDYNGIVSEMKEKGIELSMEGVSVKNVPGLRWGYFDSEDKLPFIFEIFNELEVS